jgi:pyruvate dehydrogenase E2 component (dihydrolipoamide acetyltransferase)
LSRDESLGGHVARVLRMPEVADDPTSATLTAWLVGESGDFVGAQSIATVETDSSLLSIEVAEPGVLIRSLVEPGDPVTPGSPLAVLGAPGEVIEDVEQLMVQLGLAVALDAHDTSVQLRTVSLDDPQYATTWPPHESVVDVGLEPERDAEPDPDLETEPEARLEAQLEAQPDTDLDTEPEAQLGTDLDTDLDTNLDTELDTNLDTAPGNADALVAAASAEPLDEPVVVRRVVGWADAVAEAVVDAVLVAGPRPADGATTVRQVQLREVIRAEELLSIVSKLDTVSLIALVVKAVAVTSRRVPLRPGTSSIADVAVQRWTRRGTVAPVVHVANLMTVSSLTTTLADLDARGRQGRLAGGELEPASVTIVDLGTEGVAEGYLDATPVHPAVLTLGSVVVRPVVQGGALVPGRVMTISLSCDAHRVRSAVAARWLAHLAGLLEEPLHFLT